MIAKLSVVFSALFVSAGSESYVLRANRAHAFFNRAADTDLFFNSRLYLLDKRFILFDFRNVAISLQVDVLLAERIELCFISDDLGFERSRRLILAVHTVVFNRSFSDEQFCKLFNRFNREAFKVPVNLIVTEYHGKDENIILCELFL